MQWLNLQDDVNLLSFIGAILIILVTLVVVGRMFKYMKEKEDETELSEHGRGGVGEYKNATPIGWAVIFFLTIVWAVWYFLWGYPLNSYSSIGEYDEEVKAYNTKFEGKFQNLSTKDRVAMGQDIPLVQCSVCHGITGDGINGKAQNLNIWGSEEGLIDAIKHGAKGINFPGGEMPAAADLRIVKEDIPAIVAYITKELSAIKRASNESLVAKGKEAYATCAACHGGSGKGQDGVFPDFTKYGSAAFVVGALHSGKTGFIGAMPAFSILNDTQKEAVGEYVISLSEGG